MSHKTTPDLSERTRSTNHLAPLDAIKIRYSRDEPRFNRRGCGRPPEDVRADQALLRIEAGTYGQLGKRWVMVTSRLCVLTHTAFAAFIDVFRLGDFLCDKALAAAFLAYLLAFDV